MTLAELEARLEILETMLLGKWERRYDRAMGEHVIVYHDPHTGAPRLRQILADRGFHELRDLRTNAVLVSGPSAPMPPPMSEDAWTYLR